MVLEHVGLSAGLHYALLESLPRAQQFRVDSEQADESGMSLRRDASGRLVRVAVRVIQELDSSELERELLNDTFQWRNDVIEPATFTRVVLPCRNCVHD